MECTSTYTYFNLAFLFVNWNIKIQLLLKKLEKIDHNKVDVQGHYFILIKKSVQRSSR